MRVLLQINVASNMLSIGKICEDIGKCPKPGSQRILSSR